MADYELIGLNEAAPDLRAPTSADRGIVVGGVRVSGLSELDGGADINGDPVATVSRTNPLRQAVRVAMTAAASGSIGIQVLDNANLDMGTNNFTLHWEGSLPDWTPSAVVGIFAKLNLGVAAQGFSLTLDTTGALRFYLRASGAAILNNVLSTSAVQIADGSSAKITTVIVRESGAANGSLTFYVNGVQLGAAISIASAAVDSISNAINMYFSGGLTARTASDTQQAIIYNRALSAAEVLSLCVNGPALADIGASQTVLTSGTLVSGGRYRIDTFVAGDSFTNVGAGSNASGVEFIATGTTPTTWTNSSSLRRIGITGMWNAQDAQSDTGQIFDSSGNKNHALLPAAGATIIGKEVSVPKQVRWTNTWAGTNELQYIGGVNQAILPAKAYIESIVGVITGATVEDIIIGDGSDTDRYVTITTGLAAGTVTFTLANRTTDGTNLKLTVDPDANATMSIAWTITYRTLE